MDKKTSPNERIEVGNTKLAPTHGRHATTKAAASADRRGESFWPEQASFTSGKLTY
jgi:hypothetical protein